MNSSLVDGRLGFVVDAGYQVHLAYASGGHDNFWPRMMQWPDKEDVKEALLFMETKDIRARLEFK